jgi:signal peptidase II
VLMIRSSTPGMLLASGLAAITGGGLSNMIDRIAFQWKVTDFMNLGIGNFRTGIFNVADVSIMTGCLLVLIFELRRKPEKKDILKPD